MKEPLFIHPYVREVIRVRLTPTMYSSFSGPPGLTSGTRAIFTTAGRSIFERHPPHTRENATTAPSTSGRTFDLWISPFMSQVHPATWDLPVKVIGANHRTARRL